MDSKSDSQFLPFSLDWERISLSLISGLTYLALSTPLIVSSKFFFPYVVPKTIFFRLIVCIILIAYIFLVLSNRRYLPKINLLTIILAIFIGVFFLAGLFGVNFEGSFWSNFERMTGILTLLHLFAFFLVLTNVFQKREDWERFFTFSLGVGTIIGLYFLFGTQELKLAATLGNTTFMAGYLLFNIFFGLMLFFSKKGASRPFYAFCFLIMVSALLASTTRAAIAAFWGGLFLFTFGYFFLLPRFTTITTGRRGGGREPVVRACQKRYSSKKALFIFALLVITAAVLLGTTGLFQKTIAKIQQEPTFKSRLILSQIALKGWQERPWLGWGPENFNIVFSKYFDPRLFLKEYGGQHWFDRAHNIILDTLVETGIIGLLSYLAIFVFCVFLLFRNFLRTQNRKESIFSLGMAILLLSYFAQNLLVFDMIGTYIMFFLSLAFINFLVTPEKEKRKTGEVQLFHKFLRGFLLVIVIVIVIVTLYWGNAKPGLASYYTLQGIAVPLDKAGFHFQKAFLLSSVSKTEVPEQFARKIFRTQLRTERDKAILEKTFPLAINLMEKVVRERPLDLRLHLALGELYYRFYLFNQEKEYLEKAEDILRRAAVLSPKNQQVFWQLSQVKLLREDKEVALSLLKKAIALEPRLALSHWYLAKTHSQFKDFSQAKEKLLEAENLGYDWRANPLDFQEVIKIYQGLGDYEKVISLSQQGLKIWPKNIGLWLTLIKSYENLGQEEKAQETLNLLKTFFPKLDVERLLDKDS